MKKIPFKISFITNQPKEYLINSMSCQIENCSFQLSLHDLIKITVIEDVSSFVLRSNIHLLINHVLFIGEVFS